MSYFNFKTSLIGAACKHYEHSKVLVLNKKCFPYRPPGGGGGTRHIFGWGGAARSLIS